MVWHLHMAIKKNYILAIESSCDDTSAAVLCNTKVLSNVVATQEIHRQYGGVVPELASRDHVRKIVFTVVEIQVGKIQRRKLKLSIENFQKFGMDGLEEEQ